MPAGDTTNLISGLALLVAVVGFCVNFAYTWYTRRQLHAAYYPDIEVSLACTRFRDEDAVFVITLRNLHTAVAVRDARFTLSICLHNEGISISRPRWRLFYQGSFPTIHPSTMEEAKAPPAEIVMVNDGALGWAPGDVNMQGEGIDSFLGRQFSAVDPKQQRFDLQLQIHYRPAVASGPRRVWTRDFVLSPIPETLERWKVIPKP